ncbi:Ribosomal protein S18 acetylase RimI [Cruoricaptor ignavus]|uniref:Ribosomal protein S18 acetylase RimI n=1 Tax=Cruoricaptor ignavus TaxID=1118202 RepID=A0A1M6H591_9FLAO|nr:GNAT family N-acetyltransferase [Cruoricaptor ignavus]SHJ17249.1 Ribosomal protein S18 acetylase RimI [Cruoricaptor ignavus]
MDFQKVKPENPALILEIFSAYSKTFPEEERRDEAQFSAILQNEKAAVFSIQGDFENIGYIVIWKLSDFYFIEHFEVYEKFRSKGFGSKILAKISDIFPKIILESEPSHLNKIAENRIKFYEKNGFKIIDKHYLQPSYRNDNHQVLLFLMANFSTENLDEIKDEIFRTVYSKTT